MTATTTPAKPQDTRGLAGQTVGDTEICAVNQTSLLYRGYEIADLAEHATFEEVAHLLLIGHKPSRRGARARSRPSSSHRCASDARRPVIDRTSSASPAPCSPDAHRGADGRVAHGRLLSLGNLDP